MNTICSAGILYLCMIGKVADDEIKIQQVNTYQNAFDFCVRSKELLQIDHDIAIYAVLGIKDKVKEMADAIELQIKGNFDKLLKGEQISRTGYEYFDHMGSIFNQLIQESIFEEDQLKFPRKYVKKNGAWEMHCFWAGDVEDEDSYMLIEDIVELWCSHEQPMIFGKQVMIQSFQLADLKGRKIIGVYSDRETQEWIAVLEGGMKLALNSETPYMRERIGTRDGGQILIGDIDSILNNPIYAYGKCFYPVEIYEEWHKVFLYAAALETEEWDIREFRETYERFLAFVEANICDVRQVDVMCIDRDTYHAALMLTVKEVQKYLAGEDSPVISRDLWILLNSRYVYLPYIYEQMSHPKYGQYMSNKSAEFDRKKMMHIIRSSEVQDAYQKGIRWEEAVEYFLDHIDNLRISGRRVQAIAQEIDFSIVNTSLDPKLWEMGAYILVECKNWKKRGGIEVIRGVSHISELKGNKTTFLFTANGITRRAEEEIVRSAVNGKYILSITKAELQAIENKQECYELLVQKWDELSERVEQDWMAEDQR